MKIIAHIADIHIKASIDKSRDIEYDTVFNKLYEDMKTLKPDTIFIAGDIFESGRVTDGGTMTKALDFLTKISQCAKKTIVIPGNHDLDVNVKNYNCVLSAIIKDNSILQSNNLHYLAEPGMYIFDDELWGLADVCTGTVDENSHIITDSTLHQDKLKIGLFHEDIEGAAYESGSIVKERADRVLRTTDFKNYDFVMGGHIHNYQLIPNRLNIPIAYAGSLLMQSYSEKPGQHGYIIWRIDDKKVTYEFVPILNPFEMFSISFKNDLLITDLTLIEHIKTPRSWRIFIDFDETRISEHPFVNAKINELSAIYGRPSYIKDIPHRHLKSAEQEVVEDTLDYHISLFKNVLPGVSDDIMQQVIQIYRDNFNTSETPRKLIKLVSLKFSNLFSYGVGNHIDFEKMTGSMSGISGPNERGKTSIVNIVLLALHGPIAEMTKAEVLRRGAASYSTELEIRVNSDTWVINRNSTAHSTLSICINGVPQQSSLNSSLMNTIIKNNTIISPLLNLCFMRQGKISNIVDNVQTKTKATLQNMLGIQDYKKLYELYSSEHITIKSQLKELIQQETAEVLINKKIHIEVSKKQLEETIERLNSELAHLIESNDQLQLTLNDKSAYELELAQISANITTNTDTCASACDIDTTDILKQLITHNAELKQMIQTKTETEINISRQQVQIKKCNDMINALSSELLKYSLTDITIDDIEKLQTTIQHFNKDAELEIFKHSNKELMLKEKEEKINEINALYNDKIAQQNKVIEKYNTDKQSVFENSKLSQQNLKDIKDKHDHEMAKNRIQLQNLERDYNNTITALNNKKKKDIADKAAEIDKLNKKQELDNQVKKENIRQTSKCELDLVCVDRIHTKNENETFNAECDAKLEALNTEISELQIIIRHKRDNIKTIRDLSKSHPLCKTCNQDKLDVRANQKLIEEIEQHESELESKQDNIRILEEQVKTARNTADAHIEELRKKEGQIKESEYAQLSATFYNPLTVDRQGIENQYTIQEDKLKQKYNTDKKNIEKLISTIENKLNALDIHKELQKLNEQVLAWTIENPEPVPLSKIQQEHRTAIASVESQYKSDLDLQIKNKLIELNEKYDHINKINDSIKANISQLQASIDSHIQYMKIKAQIAEKQDELHNIQHYDIEPINNSIESVKICINECNNKLLSKKLFIVSKLDELKLNKTTMTDNNKIIDKYRAEISTHNKLIGVYCNTLNEINKSICKANDNNEKINTLKSRQSIVEACEKLFGPNGLIFTLTEDKLVKVVQRADVILKRCSSGTYDDEPLLKLVSDASNIEFQFKSTSSGKYSPVSSESGYRKFIIGLALNLAIWQTSDGTILDAMFIDEGLSVCDEINLYKIIEFIDEVASTDGLPSIMFVISHQTAVNSTNTAGDLEIVDTPNGRYINNTNTHAPCIIPSIMSSTSSFADLSPATVSEISDTDVFEIQTDVTRLKCLVCNTIINKSSKSGHTKTKKHKESLPYFKK